MKPSQVPSLEGYVTFPQTAEILGVSKQGVHAMVFRFNVFGDAVRKVGDQPTYLLRLADVRRVARARAAKQQPQIP